MEEKKVYKIVVDEEDNKYGMKGISVVDEGAIESDFITLSKHKQQYVLLKDETGKKSVLAGLALIPEKKIYRAETSEFPEHYVYFEAEDIEKIRNKFHKDKLTDVVNVQHNQKDDVEGYLIESYILSSDDRVEEVKNQGIEEACLGAWYVQYKIEDEEVYEKAVEGELNGFSIEIMGKYVEEKLNKNYKKTKNMSKVDKILNKFKAVLEEFEVQETELEAVETTIKDTDNIVSYEDIDMPVYAVEGEDRQLMTEGEYVLDNGKTIVVDENGNLTSITDTPAEEEVEEEMKEDKKEEMEESEDKEDNKETKFKDSVQELMPKNEKGELENGTYMIDVFVEDGKISYGSMYTSTYKELEFKAQEDYKKVVAEKDETISKLQKQVEELKKENATTPTQLSTEVSKPKLTKKTAKNNLELLKNKFGLDQ